MPTPPSDNFDLFGADLFGSTALSPTGIAPIGLIRIPMKEDPAEPDENAHLYDDAPSTPAKSFSGREASRVTSRNFRLAGNRNLAAGWNHRALDNLAAIRVLQKIEQEGRGRRRPSRPC